MQIYITGDVHGDLQRFQPDIFYEQESLTKEDIVLVCGDFGCVWYGDERDNEDLDWLEGRPFTTVNWFRFSNFFIEKRNQLYLESLAVQAFPLFHGWSEIFKNTPNAKLKLLRQSGI